MTEQTIQDRIAQRQEALAVARREEQNLLALRTLIDNNGLAPAPNSTRFIDPTYKCVTVGIGRDHTATLYVTQGDLDALKHLLGETEE